MLFEIYIWIISFISTFVAILWIILNFATKYYDKKLPDLKTFPNITVAVPVWNEEKAVIQTLKSIFSQDYPTNNLEVIVVDDKSKDNTIKVLNNFISKSKFKIKLIKHNQNLGKGGALNTALKEATGEYFWVYDADSVSDKNLLKNMVKYFYDKNNSDVAAVVAITLIKNKGNFIARMQNLEYVMAAFVRKLLGTADTLHITNALSLFRTSILKKIGGFDVGNLTEDFEIAMRLRYNDYRIVMCEHGNFRTQVPTKIKTMWMQRVRWFRGFMYNNLKYKKMILNKNYGLLGMFQIPLEVFVLLCVFFSIGLFGYHIVTLFLDLAFKIYIMKLAFLEFDFPTLLQFILNLNWNLLFPSLVVLFLGLYLYLAAHKYVGEKWKFYIPSLIYIFIYPLFRSMQWLHAFILEFSGAEKKW